VAPILAAFLDDVRELLGTPLAIEGILAIVLFVGAILAFRRLRGVAEELERRKTLGDYVRGLDEFLRGDYRQAIATLEAVLAGDPENVEARIALGDCYREVGDAAEAKKHHHHVHKVFGHELARNFVSLGLDEIQLKNHERAVEAFEGALRLSPRDPDALGGMARAYAEAGDAAEAAACLRRLHPGGPAEDLGAKERRDASKRFAEAGQAALEGGDAEEAVRLFTEALAFEPRSVRARTGLVRAAHGLGDPERARQLVEEHVAELKRLSADEGVLFEPAAPRRATPHLAEAASPSGDGAKAGPPAPPVSFLPARIEEVGAVVAQVERKTARYACAQCGALHLDYAERCPACGAVGRVEALPEVGSLYLMPIANFHEAVDEVEESAAFVQALARRAAAGDEAALKRLLERGAAALYDVFAALPGITERRSLGARLAQLGPQAALEVRQCHAARGGGSGGTARPHDEFTAAFYLALPAGDGEVFLRTLGEAHDSAVAGVLADPRVPFAVRDAAAARLRGRGGALVPLVEAVAASGDGADRAAAIVRDLGPEGVDAIERRFLTGSLLTRILGGQRGSRRRAVADILAATKLDAAAQVLARAAAREKDPALRAHYLAAKERAEAKR
jgi:lipopolysaccharide biosynthesis regulator YciM